MPPVIGHPAEHRVVIAAARAVCHLVPASGRAEAKWPVTYTRATPASTRRRRRRAAASAHRPPDQVAATSLVPIATAAGRTWAGQQQPDHDHRGHQERENAQRERSGCRGRHGVSPPRRSSEYSGLDVRRADRLLVVDHQRERAVGVVRGQRGDQRGAAQPATSTPFNAPSSPPTSTASGSPAAAASPTALGDAEHHAGERDGSSRWTGRCRPGPTRFTSSSAKREHRQRHGVDQRGGQVVGS